MSNYMVGAAERGGRHLNLVSRLFSSVDRCKQNVDGSSQDAELQSCT